MVQKRSERVRAYTCEVLELLPDCGWHKLTGRGSCDTTNGKRRSELKRRLEVNTQMFTRLQGYK